MRLGSRVARFRAGDVDAEQVIAAISGTYSNERGSAEDSPEGTSSEVQP
jgi:hypothetical protein